jgi:hypothetical protein
LIAERLGKAVRRRRELLGNQTAARPFGRNIGCALAMFGYSMMYRARPSRFWRS